MATQDDIGKLKRSRAGHRAVVTRTLNEVPNLCTSESEDAHNDLMGVKRNLIKQQVLLATYDKTIADSMEGEEYIKELEEANKVSILIESAVAKIDLTMEKRFAKIPAPAMPPSNQVTVRSTQEVSKVRLPKLSLKSFSGDPLDYQPFIQTFRSSVDGNQSLNDIDKFTYLRSVIEGSAAATISGLALSESNYKVALELLDKRFGDKNILISNIVDSLLKLQPVSYVEDVMPLRKLYDTVESNLRNLKAVGVESKQYGSVMVPIILSKLPAEIRLEITRKCTSEVWDFDDILKSLLNEVVAREKCFVTASGTQNETHDFNRMVTASSLPTFRSKHTHKSNAADSFRRYSDRKFADSTSRKSYELCVFCQQAHKSWQCDVIKEVSARKDAIRHSNRCFVCLKSGHRARDCRSKFNCFTCKGKHHSALCEQKPRDEGAKIDKPSTDKSVTMISAISESVLLPTATAWVVSENSAKENVRLLFDSCSQLSYISRDLVNRLDLKVVGKKVFVVKGFAGLEKKLCDYDIVSFNVCTRCGPSESIRISAFVTDSVCSPLSQQEVRVAVENYSHLRKLDLAETSLDSGEMKIHILVGADNYWRFVSSQTRRGRKGPTAVKSKLGWLISGPLELPLKGPVSCSNVTTTHVLKVASYGKESDFLHDEVKRFWEIDSLGIVEGQDKDVYADFLKSIRYDGKQYEVGLPWKPEHEDISDNYGLCLRRLMSLLRHLRQQPDVLKEYDSLISEQLKAGIVEVCQTDEAQSLGSTHYLCHHPVIRADKETTKLRIVYNASMAEGGVSLNSCLFKGPALSELMFNILLRFRLFKIAFVADIKQAFLMVRVREEERNFLRFLWVNDILADQPSIIALRFCTIVFGLTSSPFLLNATIRHHLRSCADIDKVVVEKIIRSLYVDDLNSGADTREPAYDLFVTAKSCLQKAGFTLRKFHTNDTLLQESVDKASGIELECENSEAHKVVQDTQSYSQSSLGEATQNLKVLGVQWDNLRDLFIFKFEEIIQSLQVPRLTKRIVLSGLTRFFDPLGILCPILLSLKLIFQELCTIKLDWDDDVPAEFVTKVEHWCEDARSIGFVEVPRYCLSLGERKCVDLIGFADGSKRAYGAVVYLRSRLCSGETEVSMLTAKSRVAPLKEISIPRMELLGAVILCRLVKAVKEAIQNDLKVDRVFLFTDSTCCLSWIKCKAHEYRQFVHNRVVEVRALSADARWGYVDSEQNPADFSSRPTAASQLVHNRLWWQGPEFLRKSEEFWPQAQVTEPPQEAESEVCLVTVRPAPEYESPTRLAEVFDLRRFSDSGCLFRVTAMVLTFVSMLRKQVKNGTLLVKDVQNARNLWIREEQRKQELDKAAFRKAQYNLKLFSDSDGIYRCKGRLEHSCLEYGQKYPIFVPNGSALIKLIIAYYHFRVKHAGVTQTLSELRSTFWICKGRQAVRKFVRQCHVCKRSDGRPYSTPTTAPLPEFRVSGTTAFQCIGLDHAGPLWVRDVYGSSSMNKAYILLATCATSRGIHLELSPDLSSQALIRAMQRLFARRGVPALCISDNAANFKSAEVIQFARERDIEWKFNLEQSPWQGGFFERMVQSTKRCLRKVLGQSRLTFEEMSSVLAEVEAVINSRPITYVSSDELEEAITPSHLMIGKRLLSCYDKPVTDFNSDNVAERYKHLQNVLHHFWSRWRGEYLLQLRERDRIEPGGERVPKIDDVVLISDESQPRLKWKMGRVTKLIVGADGVVRGAEVAVKGGATLKRPCQKLYPLEVATEEPIVEGEPPPVVVDDASHGEETKEQRPQRLAARTGQFIRRILGHK